MATFFENQTIAEMHDGSGMLAMPTGTAAFEARRTLVNNHYHQVNEDIANFDHDFEQAKANLKNVRRVYGADYDQYLTIESRIEARRGTLSNLIEQLKQIDSELNDVHEAALRASETEDYNTVLVAKAKSDIQSGSIEARRRVIRERIDQENIEIGNEANFLNALRPSFETARDEILEREADVKFFDRLKPWLEDQKQRCEATFQKLSPGGSLTSFGETEALWLVGPGGQGKTDATSGAFAWFAKEMGMELFKDAEIDSLENYDPLRHALDLTVNLTGQIAASQGYQSVMTTKESVDADGRKYKHADVIYSDRMQKAGKGRLVNFKFDDVGNWGDSMQNTLYDATRITAKFLPGGMSIKRATVFLTSNNNGAGARVKPPQAPLVNRTRVIFVYNTVADYREYWKNVVMDSPSDINGDIPKWWTAHYQNWAAQNPDLFYENPDSSKPNAPYSTGRSHEGFEFDQMRALAAHDGNWAAAFPDIVNAAKMHLSEAGSASYTAYLFDVVSAWAPLAQALIKDPDLKEGAKITIMTSEVDEDTKQMFTVSKEVDAKEYYEEGILNNFSATSGRQRIAQHLTDATIATVARAGSFYADGYVPEGNITGSLESIRKAGEHFIPEIKNALKVLNTLGEANGLNIFLTDLITEGASRIRKKELLDITAKNLGGVTVEDKSIKPRAVGIPLQQLVFDLAPNLAHEENAAQIINKITGTEMEGSAETLATTGSLDRAQDEKKLETKIKQAAGIAVRSGDPEAIEEFADMPEMVAKALSDVAVKTIRDSVKNEGWTADSAGNLQPVLYLKDTLEALRNPEISQMAVKAIHDHLSKPIKANEGIDVEEFGVRAALEKAGLDVSGLTVENPKKGPSPRNGKGKKGG